jgi:hypothetical protein
MNTDSNLARGIGVIFFVAWCQLLSFQYPSGDVMRSAAAHFRHFVGACFKSDANDTAGHCAQLLRFVACFREVIHLILYSYAIF